MSEFADYFRPKPSPFSDAEALAWFRWSERQNQSGPVDLTDALNEPPGPSWFSEDAEYQYRKGYQFGMIDAAKYARALYKKGGYVRPTEIANILDYFAQGILHAWRRKAHQDARSAKHGICRGEPQLQQPGWIAMRKAVLARDGFECLECGATEDLQADHIWPVADGGVPELDNLQTLCRACNMAKGVK